ncbi:U4/U6 small nuclear ribonucleoprotein PRP31 [Geosmithia morbida]|uniref:U4/U6 small nuclear ribonucleoprotein PRP31 n=1 Tax=Geosmithia morbida TaxID=1094350 RepID=A0A9P4YT39_9HYPO|nr:U4/U6 small nuclear ribonucleoprotein PRP31 [Geosmithia morbida]KAF4122618.1 U4/U6 small nuclear ribonucleoprotein PRP31 [Geosmithia morbida]
MTSVADDLLNDFGSSGDEADDNVEQEGSDGNGNGDGDGHENDDDDDDAMHVDGTNNGVGSGYNGDDDDNVDGTGVSEARKAKVDNMKLSAVKDIRKVAGLMQTLEPILKASNRNLFFFFGLLYLLKGKKKNPNMAETQTTNAGNIEDHPEYHLLTQSNNLSTKIDGEVYLVHKYIRDHYSTRFPELERLVTLPLEYAKVAMIIGNGPMNSERLKSLQTSTDNPLGVTLKSVLNGPSLMVVTLEATTSKGQEMSAEQEAQVRQGCEMLVSLTRAKETLTDYVQSRMRIFAPNMTALIGSLTAAQLLNTAGGLTNLSKTPACNLPGWGSKKGQAGLATNTGVRQQGFLFHSETIRGIPADLKTKAMRIVAAKLVLAARIDRGHSSPDGSEGENLKAECFRRLEKLTEPPPNKGGRALGVPDDKPARKRGGRRARKAKEAVAMTDLRTAQNRMAFGKEEREVGYGTGSGTVGMGMIGQQNDGRIRGIQVDQRTRAKLSAKNKGWGTSSSIGGGGLASSIGGFGQTPGGIDLHARGLRGSGVGSTVGTASSLSFTPVQGLELVDPKMQAELSRKRKAEEDRWFKGGTFTQVGGGGGGSSNADGGGFKVPNLPPTKRVDTGASKMGPPPKK